MAKTVVLLHGVSSSHTTWWRAVRDLAELGWDVHALDLLGHGGRTTAPGQPITLDDLAADVVDQLADRGFASEPVDLVIGHSLGAVVALTVAAREPEFARRLVLEDPPGLSVRPGPTVAEMVENSHAQAFADPALAIAQALGDNPSWAPIDAEGMVLNLLSTDIPAVTAFLRASTWDLAALVEACPIPLTLLAATEPGTSLSDPVREQVVEHLGPERFSVISGGHNLHRDRPALWLLAVLSNPALAH